MNDIVIYYVALGPALGLTLIAIGYLQHFIVLLNANSSNESTRNAARREIASSCFNKTWLLWAWALALSVPIANLWVIGMTIKLISEQKVIHAK